MERSSARYLRVGYITELIDLIFCDLSITDLKTLLLTALALAGSGIYFMAVVKAQFEVSKGVVERVR